MSLSPEQKKRMRSIGHQLNPIVTVAGNGLTENIQLEVDRALADHELIKVRFVVGDRELKRKMVEELCTITECQLVQLIGHIALLYRPAPTPNPKLSNLLRWQEV